MFHKIDYGTDKNFEPVRVTRVESPGQSLGNKLYTSGDIIYGKSLLTRDKKSGELTILNFMKEMNASTLDPNDL